MLFIEARFQSNEETLRMYTNYSSPTGSYIQIIPVNTLPAQVSSKGQVVAAGTESFSSSVALTPELSWYPEACVTVTLQWGSERAQPGEQVSLTVAASESMFQVLITVTAMQNDALQSDLDPRVEQSEAFEFVLMNRRGASVVNAQKLTLGSHASASALFPIRALAVGEMDISPYMQIDQTVLTKATAWLLKHQGSQGEFTEVGQLIHTEMQGGTDDSSLALTAYVLLAFLEDKAYSDTVVALQALAYYAAFSGANAINLKFNISSPLSSSAMLFHINSTNYRVYQSREVTKTKS
ncbi:hypothetical protein XENOCAPTIV_010440 [Xenoophorus captivus]|uniref:Alpha-macroglobulin-like TED domain-containing protein n=1 Tax=Xenoophorus captivus TaxID=1517983 RepID=A0ABV0RGR4_9TELE